jgi:hypothetical protein
MVFTETLYIEGATGLVERLTRIEAIIEALELRQVEVIGKSNVEEYQLDDGQVRIKTIYRSADQIAKAIEAYERLKQKILNKLNGRQMVLRPWQGLS